MKRVGLSGGKGFPGETKKGGLSPLLIQSFRDAYRSRPIVAMMPRLTRVAQGADRQTRARQREIVDRLKVHPESRGRPEGLAEEPGGTRRHAALVIDEFIHALNRDMDMRRKLNLGDGQGLQELFKKDLAWMGWGAVGWDHGAPVSGNQ